MSQVRILREARPRGLMVRILPFQGRGAGSIPVGGTFMRDFLLRVCFALLAQLVEQRTLNPWVAGSSPAGRT